jgi:hypothetical protein
VRLIVLILLYLLNLPYHLLAEEPGDEADAGWIHFDYGLDLYYSYAGLLFDYNQQPIPDMGSSSPTEIFNYLLFDAGFPKNVYLEASIYPAPFAGGLLRKYNEDLYLRGDWEQSLNMWEVVTTGFEEPYALSLVFGNITKFDAENSNESIPGNIGLLGIVVSAGTYHIKENFFIKSKWLETEFKFKGDQVFRKIKRSWSFFLGMKVHELDDISDCLTASVKFDSLSFYQDADFLDNVGFLYRFELNYKTWEAALHKFEVNKKWPSRNSYAYSLKFAILYYAPGKYKGSLSTRRLDNEFQFALRPGIHF